MAKMWNGLPEEIKTVTIKSKAKAMIINCSPKYSNIFLKGDKKNNIFLHNYQYNTGSGWVRI
jgi:hypothetical protein